MCVPSVTSKCRTGTDSAVSGYPGGLLELWCAIVRVRGPRDSVGETRAGYGSNPVHAELWERRMGAARSKVGARIAVQGPVGTGASAHCDRQARWPRLRVPDPSEAHHNRAQLEPRPGGRKHGTLEFHLAPAPWTVLRSPGVLPHVQQQEWRSRRWCVPEEGIGAHAAAKKVCGKFSYISYNLFVCKQCFCYLPTCWFFFH